MSIDFALLFACYVHFCKKNVKCGKIHLQNNSFGATITNGLFSKGEK
jgi:hypothetical protein